MISIRDAANLKFWVSPAAAYQDAARSNPATANGQAVLGLRDLSNNSNHVVSGAAVLTTGSSGINGQPALRFPSSELVSPAFLSSGYDGAMSLYIVFQLPTVSSLGTVVALGTGGQSLWAGGGRSNSLSLTNLNMANAGGNSAGTPGAQTTLVLAMTYDGATRTNAVGRVLSAAAQTGAVGLAGLPLILGNFAVGNSGYRWPGLLGDVMVYQVAHSAAQAKIIIGDLMAQYSATGPLLFADGNSRTLGIGATQGTTDWPTQCAALLAAAYGPLWTVTNVGVSGQTWEQMTTKAPAQDDPNWETLRTINGQPASICTAWEGFNDIHGNGLTGVQTYANQIAFCAPRTAAGAQTIVFTELYGSTMTAPQIAAMDDFNARVRSDFPTPAGRPNIFLPSPGVSHAKVMVDLAANTILGPFAATSNTTYYADGTHLTAAGYAIVAAYVKDAISMILSPPVVRPNY